MDDLDLTRRLHRDLDPIATEPAPFDDLRTRVARRGRRRRVGAGVLGAAVSVAVITGAWTAADRQADRSGPPATQGATARTEALFLAGDGEAWIVDPTRQTARHLSMPELPPGDAPHRVARRGGELVAWAYETLIVHPGDDPATEVLVPDSLVFIPSSAPDRVWVGIYDDGRDDARLSSVREVSVKGDVTVPDTHPPDGAWPIAAVGDDLVFQRGDHLVVWDPATRQDIDRLPGAFPLAWQGDLLAWCDGRCEELRLTDVAAGTTILVEPPDGAVGFEALRGAYSPDGRTLAVAARLAGGRDAERQLTLIDPSTGRTTPVERAIVATPYVFIDWAPSGDAVFITGGQDAGRRQVVEYRVGDAAASVVEVSVGDFYGMAAFAVDP